MSDRSPRDSRSGQARAMLPAWPSALVVIAHARLRLLGDREYLRWLVPPAAAITSESAR